MASKLAAEKVTEMEMGRRAGVEESEAAAVLAGREVPGAGLAGGAAAVEEVAAAEEAAAARRPVVAETFYARQGPALRPLTKSLFTP